MSKELRKGKSLDSLSRILIRYDGDDWEKYEKYNPDHYSSNLVFQNDILEMVICCWKKDQRCSPHNHPANSHLIKVLKGKLRENTFIKSDQLKFIRKTIIHTDQVACQQGQDIIHSIWNNANQQSVSLHLYSPPGYKTIFY